MEQNKRDATINVIKNDHYYKVLDRQMEIEQGKVYNRATRTIEQEADKMSQQYITEKDLVQLEEKIDLKIKVAIQPIEGKIDNLPTQFENLLLKERQYQDDKVKETRRYIWGTIGVGVLSIIVSVVLNFV